MQNAEKTPHIRWMIRRDICEVLAIERESFPTPWSEDDFVKCLRHKNCIGVVAEQDNEVVAFTIYELHKTRLEILNFAVAMKHRRKRIGTVLMDWLKSKLSVQRRSRLAMVVIETNLAAQLFLRSQGFKALSVAPDAFVDSDDDAYLFDYRLPGLIPPTSRFSGLLI